MVREVGSGTKFVNFFGRRKAKKNSTNVKVKYNKNGVVIMTDNKISKGVLSINEAMNVLGISRSLAYRLVKEGKLPTIRLGRKILIPVSALEKILSTENA